MLELELIPEKSLASDQWEFTLGKAFNYAIFCFLFLALNDENLGRSLHCLFRIFAIINLSEMIIVNIQVEIFFFSLDIGRS